MRFAAGAKCAAAAKKKVDHRVEHPSSLPGARKVYHEVLSNHAIAVGSYAGAPKTAWVSECKRL